MQKKVISIEFCPIWLQMASSIILTNLSAKGTSKWYFDQFECNNSQRNYDQSVCKRVYSMEFWPIWVQKGYLNEVLTNLSAKELVQWSFDQSECKNGDLSEVLTNLSAKGLVQWGFDQSECKKGDLNGVLTNLRTKGFNQWSLGSNLSAVWLTKWSFWHNMRARGITQCLSAVEFWVISLLRLNVTAKGDDECKNK